MFLCSNICKKCFKSWTVFGKSCNGQQKLIASSIASAANNARQPCCDSNYGQVRAHAQTCPNPTICLGGHGVGSGRRSVTSDHVYARSKEPGLRENTAV